MGALSVTDTQAALLDCVCAALAAGGRPTCSCYTTIGTPMSVQCCECEEGISGEVSISFRGMYDADPETLEQVYRVHPCRTNVVAADFTVTLYRCFPVLDEHGEVPDHDLQSERADEMNMDASLLWTALTCCSDLRVVMDGISADQDPTTCSVLTADITVEVRPSLGIVTSP